MLALDIAKGAVDVSGKIILPLHFAMSRDSEVLKVSHAAAADAVRAHLDAGRDVALLNLGDVSIYATYGYLEEILKEQGYETYRIAGVPSFCAAAARLGCSLTGGMEQPADHRSGPPRRRSAGGPGHESADEDGRQLPRTLEALARHGLLEKSAMVCNCGLPDEAVFPALTDYDPAQDAGYFATILVKE